MPNTTVRSFTQKTLDMAGISDQEREVLSLRFWHDLDQFQTGRRLSLSATQIRNLERSALRKIVYVVQHQALPTTPHQTTGTRQWIA